MKSRRLIGLWSFVALAATGCSHVQTQPLREPNLASSRIQLNVPFFPQTTDQCGPSSLASLLNFWGKPAEPATLKNEVYVAKLKGTLPVDMLLAAQGHGLYAEAKEATLDHIRAEVRAGRPSIAFLNRGFSFLPIGHFVVVTGFDADGVYAHSAGRADQYFPNSAFERQWSKADRWLLIARPQAEIARRHAF